MGHHGNPNQWGSWGPQWGQSPWGGGPPWGRGGRSGPPPWVTGLFGLAQGEQQRAPRARRGDVRAAILDVLQGEPLNGYQVISAISERTGGAWKPSPGSVYPTLQLLEDEGLISSASEGGKNLFSLTDAGREEAEAGPDAPWEEAGRGIDWEAMNEVRKAGGGLVSAFQQVWANGTQEQRDKALGVVNDARKKLYLILAEEE
jgi:DNA-binding PadR family transcriptional regulator